MRYLFILAFTAVGLFSCTNSAKQPEKEISEEVIVPDMHTAQNSLDYKGSYKRTLINDDGQEEETEIILEDDTYILTTIILPKGDVKSVEKGSYSWGNKKNTIILHGVENLPKKYFVGENYLKQLDTDGNDIETESADKYILRK